MPIRPSHAWVGQPAINSCLRVGNLPPLTATAPIALAKEGLAHILAEPNLTVMSGQSASFQAGGEYPYAVPGAGANPNSVTIDFKPYGVLLSFVPTVLSNGRINLHVKPEVSQLDSTNTVQIPGGGVVDGLLVRRTETTVELGSGETFAIAGMLQTVGNDNDSGLPGLGDVPVLGALFKSNAMTREQTELIHDDPRRFPGPVSAEHAVIERPRMRICAQDDVDQLLLRAGVTATALVGITGGPGRIHRAMRSFMRNAFVMAGRAWRPAAAKTLCAAADKPAGVDRHRDQIDPLKPRHGMKADPTHKTSPPWPPTRDPDP